MSVSFITVSLVAIVRAVVKAELREIGLDEDLKPCADPKVGQRMLVRTPKYVTFMFGSILYVHIHMLRFMHAYTLIEAHKYAHSS